MEEITSAVTSIVSMLGDVFDFVLDQPLLLVLIGIPIVGGLVYLVTGLFRK